MMVLIVLTRLYCLVSYLKLDFDTFWLDIHFTWTLTWLPVCLIFCPCDYLRDPLPTPSTHLILFTWFVNDHYSIFLGLTVILFHFQVAYQVIQSGQHYQNHHSEHNAWYDSLNCVTSCRQEVIYWPFVGGQFVPRPKNSYYILHHTLDNDENRRNDRDGLFSSLRYRISNFMGQIAKPLFSRSWNLQFESTRIRLLYARSIVLGFSSNRQGQ